MASAPLPPAPAKPVTPPPLFKGKPLSPTGSAAAAPALPKFTPPPSAIPTGPGPKKETARITVLPDPPAKPLGSVQMKKTQPLSTMPEPVAPISPIKVAAAPVPVVTQSVATVDSIPMGLCWGLLGVSALVLVVQIWNYFA
jgi:hypothetical protein